MLPAMGRRDIEGYTLRGEHLIRLRWTQFSADGAAAAGPWWQIKQRGRKYGPESVWVSVCRDDPFTEWCLPKNWCVL